jgi:hypothetical protein
VVCRCGAYFGYKEIHTESHFVVQLVCLFVGIICAAVAGSSNELGVQIICGMLALGLVLGGLIGSIVSGIKLLGGKKWWRKF